MSNSYRTEKESVKAERKIRRDPNGEIIYPRIIEHKLPKDEFHPLPKRILKENLKMIPVEYIYGLDRIELMSNKEPGVCSTYFASQSGNYIVLYSLPKIIWSINIKGIDRDDSWLFNDILKNRDTEERRKWEALYTIGLWEYLRVFLHELGHHHINKFRHKEKQSKKIKINEQSAERHKKRLEKMIFNYNSQSAIEKLTLMIRKKFPGIIEP